MPGGMAGHIDHLPGQAQQIQPVATPHGLARLGNVLGGGAVDPGAGGLAQLGHAARMVAVVVGHYNGLQLQIKAAQRRKRGRSLAWVDDQRVLSVVQQPDVVVVESGQR